jgi:hypothetical protein
VSTPAPILHRNLAVLTVAEPGLIEAIRAVVPLEEHVLGWLSPTEAVIDPAHLRALLDALDAAGMGALVRRG